MAIQTNSYKIIQKRYKGFTETFAFICCSDTYHGHSQTQAGCCLCPIINAPLRHKELHLYHGLKPGHNSHQDCMSDICPDAHTHVYKRTKTCVGPMAAFSHAAERCFNTLRKDSGRAQTAKITSKTCYPAYLWQTLQEEGTGCIVTASWSPARHLYHHFSGEMKAYSKQLKRKKNIKVREQWHFTANR